MPRRAMWGAWSESRSGVQRIQADGFGQVEAAVHGAGGVGAQHDVGAARRLLL